MDEKKQDDKILQDENKYDSPIAQSIEAGGNFISRSNPFFILLLILIIGLVFLAYEYITIVESKIDMLNHQQAIHNKLKKEIYKDQMGDE